ncbi:SGL domain containing protein [Asbolus verrucosus]|uniref:Regucalcin n=1 Tax=Asbolus verrucosus TaxID=1661398 RepID=A0A482WBW3_ASBVE|nr:SGL domain containing protein [Asbolus verrucosus]
MVPKIERITESYPLGEGPHWDIDSQSLYFVDCVGKNLMRYTPASQKISKASTAPKQPTFIIPVEGRKDQFIVSLDKEIAIIFWDGENDKISVVEKLCIADNPPEAPDNKFNDGKCDSSGRLWAGNSFSSMRRKVIEKSIVSGIHISNGLTFSEQAKKMYYVDSFKRTIDQFDFDVANGTITNRQVFFTLDKHSIPGFPDGMTIDNDDNLWVAIFGGSRILKIYGQKPETLLDSIEMPALEVTSMTFGGANLDELYVTTAALEFDGQKPPPPANGAIYKITGTGSKGFPIWKMNPKIERLTESITLGEAPHWDVETQSLYYVDIIGMAIYKYTPETKKSVKASVGLNQVSFIIPVEDEKNQFVVSLGRELVRIFWNSETEDIRIIEKLTEVEKSEDFIYNRFNDGKCDPSGRLWAGTLNTVAEGPLVYPPKGTLYSLDSERKITNHLKNLRIANGLAFNTKLRKMYYIDSSEGTVDQYDFDVTNGIISNRQPIFTLSKHKVTGIADGMTIDVDGNLWIAIFNGSRIIKIDPQRPETLLDTIEMPVKQITSLTFGGPDLDELYVTTGAFKIDNEELPPPDNGALYKVTNIGTKGLPAANFRLVNM